MSASRVLLAAVLLAAAAPARAGDTGESALFTAGPRLSFQSAPNPGGVVYESGESAPLTASWDTVLFQGESSADGLSFEASRKLPSGQWSAWQAAPVKRFANGRFWGKSVFSAKAAGAVKLRALDSGAGVSVEVTIYSVETFVAASREPRKSGGTVAESARGERPAVHDRSEWHAVPPHEAYTPHTPYRITLHHSDTKQTTDLAQTLQEVKFIQDFHMNGRGWNDIAYHFIIDAAGHVVEGRPEGVVGAHVENQNMGNIGIVMLGTYHPPKNDPVTKEQLDAFESVASYIVAKYGVNPDTLKGHRDYKSTDCPGDEMYAKLPELKARLKAAALKVAAADNTRVKLRAKRFKAITPQTPDFR